METKYTKDIVTMMFKAFEKDGSEVDRSQIQQYIDECNEEFTRLEREPDVHSPFPKAA